MSPTTQTSAFRPFPLLLVGLAVTSRIPPQTHMLSYLHNQRSHLPQIFTTSATHIIVYAHPISSCCAGYSWRSWRPSEGPENTTCQNSAVRVNFSQKLKWDHLHTISSSSVKFQPNPFGQCGDFLFHRELFLTDRRTDRVPCNHERLGLRSRPRRYNRQ